ncbi:MAG: alkane 1-monooxygenase, partial [Myxococcota bacterium]
WNTDYLLSNVLMLNLQRHSDHHAHGARPYQVLQSYEGLPTLPTGYPGCIMLALIPPVWFRVMNPRAVVWAGGDLNKLNRGE